MKYLKTFNNFIFENNNLNSNFWKWFGDSKVIDKDGNPIICYHGTRSIFDTFKASKSIGNNNEKDIFYIYFLA